MLRTANSAPALSTYTQRNPGALTEVFASDGKTRLGFIQADDLVRPVPANQMPKVLQDATIAIEDERFYKHTGVDYEGIIRAAVKNATSHKTVQGGSTLTMQLVRLLYTQDDTRGGLDGYKRKIREAKLARDLEAKYSKKWVVGKYLNTVPYGTVRRPVGDRRQRRRAPVLRQERQGPDAARGRDARRHAAGPVDVLAGGQRTRHAGSAATRCSARWPSSG